MLGPRTLRDRSTSRDPDGAQQGHTKPSIKEKGKQKAVMDSWVEPALAQKPSYRDHTSGSYYGVSEHMQPLGEAPNVRVKTRVKTDGARKSVLGKNGVGGGLDAQETPEGTPAPQLTAPKQEEPSSPPKIVVKGEDDEEYEPNGNIKKKERHARPRAVKRPSEASGTPSNTFPKKSKTSKVAEQRKEQSVPLGPEQYTAAKIRSVVEAAESRAVNVGKPELAAAVHQIWLWSLHNRRLTTLLQNILTQNADKQQTEEFQDHVRKAKRKLKEERETEEAAEAEEAARKLPEKSNGSQALPLRSPSKTLPGRPQLAVESVDPDTLEVKWAIKMAPPFPSTSHRSPSHTSKMSISPSKKRSGTPGSDSSLTDLTSNPDDDVDMEEPDNVVGSSTKSPSMQGKDHAAERGSLAAPNRNLKRSSADAEIHDEERDRVLAAKKRKFNESVTRDYQYEESNVREPARGTSSRLRSLRGKNGKLAAPSLSVRTAGSHNASVQGSRAVSTDLDSPLSEPLTTSSRQSTPHVWKAPKKPFGKRAKTKQSPEKKQSAGQSGMSGPSGAGRESPIGDSDNEEQSENNDFCSACGGSGFLLCCDGCDRSFHFSCLDPPLNEDASELNEPWYCYICVARRPLSTRSPEKSSRGLFAALFNSLRKRNPSNFTLPEDIRDYFEGVATDKNGSFVEAVSTRTRNRPGYDEVPDFTKIKDAKGNTLLCYCCGKSSHGTRIIIPCDYCGEHWHLDCLDPPLSNPPARGLEGKKLHDWMCPLHADHELRKVDTSLLDPRNVARKVHIRKPRNAKVVDTSLRRGFRNNGVIEVVDDESDDTDSEFYNDTDAHDDSVVHRLPSKGIKLDFIDKIKSTRVQVLRDERAYKRARSPALSQLQQANFARRSFKDKQMALNLAQFASANKDLDLGGDQVQNLVGTLIAEAPTEVVHDMMAAEDAERARSASSVIPPSPPSSDQTDQLSAEQRKELQMLQELIRRRLENSFSKT